MSSQLVSPSPKNMGASIVVKNGQLGIILEAFKKKTESIQIFKDVSIDESSTKVLKSKKGTHLFAIWKVGNKLRKLEIYDLENKSNKPIKEFFSNGEITVSKEKKSILIYYTPMDKKETTSMKWL